MTLLDAAAPVRAHYEAANTDERLMAAVQQVLNSTQGPIPARQLAAFDQFHMRGLAATQELAALAGLTAEAKVLDAGSGIGGPSRFLAETLGCHVTGIDLAPSFVAAAMALAARSPAQGLLHYDVGDLLALPYADGQFDAVWTQHVVMNIADRAGLYAEFRRVLQPGGRLAFYDVLAADDAPPLLYPTPWAQSEATSCVLTEAQTRAALADAGFTVTAWHDGTEAALEWLAQPRPAPDGPTLASVIGPRVQAMMGNFGANLREGRARLVMGRAVAQP